MQWLFQSYLSMESIAIQKAACVPEGSLASPLSQGVPQPCRVPNVALVLLPLKCPFVNPTLSPCVSFWMLRVPHTCPLGHPASPKVSLWTLLSLPFVSYKTLPHCGSNAHLNKGLIWLCIYERLGLGVWRWRGWQLTCNHKDCSLWL